MGAIGHSEEKKRKRAKGEMNSRTSMGCWVTQLYPWLVFIVRKEVTRVSPYLHLKYCCYSTREKCEFAVCSGEGAVIKFTVHSAEGTTAEFTIHSNGGVVIKFAAHSGEGAVILFAICSNKGIIGWWT